VRFLIVLLALVACGRARRDGGRDDGRELPAASPAPVRTGAPSAPADRAAASGATPTGCTLAPLPLRHAAGGRVVAIGDLHGDLAATRAALRLAGAIDDRDRWIGGDLVVVQTGDILDRGDDEQAIFDLIARLEGEAKQAGGALIMLLGNHELMNAAGDFRYVTPGGMRDFDDARDLDTSRWGHVPEPVRGRISALGPGGVYAKWLARHQVVAIVGDTVYSHAGVIGDWVAQVDAANQATRCWLDGQAGGPEQPPAVLTSDASPVWTRALGLDPADCEQAAAALARLGAKRMVVAHTVQAGGINSVCDGTVWRIDVGLASHYGGRLEVLEIAPAPRVLRGPR
jgi:hypothetical protein